MKLTRTEKIHFKSNVVDGMCYASKNLYNVANYIIRQEFFTNRKWIRYNALYSILKDTDEYKALPAQTSQQILKILDRNWKSFFRSIKDWKKNPSKYCGMPRPPQYKKKDGKNLLVFTNQQCKIKNGILKFPKCTHLEFKIRLENIDLREVRIVPNHYNYVCEIVYEKEVDVHEVKSDNVIGIDLGLTNVVTVANNFGEQPFIVKGGVVKSMNQFYNKTKAQIQSVYDLHKIKCTKRLNKITYKRNNKINDYFHKLSRYIVDYAHDHNVSVIVVGKNNGWKQECNMGKRTNQTFVQVPFDTLIGMIRYKSEEYGITVMEHEEAYTSKCSFLDNETIEKHETYKGKRFKRGLFRSNNGSIINADVNGALNIIRKAIPNAFKMANGIEGVVLHPVSISHEYICY